MRSQRLAASLAFACLWHATVSAQSGTITFEQALDSARQQAPSVLIATARIEEARGRLVGARTRFRENPTLDAATGPRSVDGETLTDIDVGVTQLFETGGQRAARIAGADAEVARESAIAQDTRRLAVRDAALAFLRTLHAQERTALLRSAEAVAADVVNVADRRYAAGDIAVLDVNVAKSVLARARAARLAADAERLAFAGALQRLIRWDGPAPVVAGTLRLNRQPDTLALIASVENRADLRALRAEVVEAEAATRLGVAASRPDVGLGARFKREEGHRAIIGELTVTLPVFANGQELRATGAARASRVRLELETTRTLAESHVRSLAAVALAREDAVRAFEQEAVPGLDENDALARRSFEVGQISLPEFLLIRRELVETRLEYLDRQLEAAEAVIERDAVAGVLR